MVSGIRLALSLIEARWGGWGRDHAILVLKILLKFKSLLLPQKLNEGNITRSLFGLGVSF